MKLSAFGEKFSRQSAIAELMEDLGSALSDNPDMIFMGGGNPAHLPALEAVFQQRLEQILADADQRKRLFGIYQSPQGDREFRRQLASFLGKQFGWKLSEANIAVSNGSQSAFFVLYNMLAGTMPDGSQRRIHLPLTPEYVGYADTGLSQEFFSATRPTIELLDDHLFKYHVDFAQLQPGDEVGALCVSRPTNPTGNVLTDAEVEHLDSIAQARNIPLIIDGAYGTPFPNILFAQATPHWNENTVLALSLSKLGLPGVRTGIVVANEEIISAFTNANTVVNLACGTLGPALAKTLFDQGEILSLTREHVTPYYQQRAQFTLDQLRKELGDLPLRVHKPEGAIFLWLWIEGLPISSQVLYQRLKDRGVLVVPGESFFIGTGDDWNHSRECIRVSFAQDEDTIRRGVALIADEVRQAFQQG